jgi:hypothetical protein
VGIQKRFEKMLGYDSGDEEYSEDGDGGGGDGGMSDEDEH